jgi:hypothetical protein
MGDWEMNTADRMQLWICLSALFCARALLFAAEPDKTFRDLFVSVPLLKQAPTLDGTVNADEWAGAGMAPRLVIFEREERLTDSQGKFYFGYTDDALWVAWQIQRPKDALAPKAIITSPDTSFWRTDDAIEFMLNCTPAGKDRPRGRDFYICWNAIGTKYDRREALTAQQSADMNWTGDWKAVSRTDSPIGWEGEARIPFAILEGAEKPAAGGRWRFQFCENRSTPEPFVALAGFQDDWFWSRDFPHFLFTGKEGVFARVLDSGAMADAGKGGLILELVNPGSAPRTVVPTMRFYKRKPDALSQVSYLRAFDQSRDRPEDIAGTGKVALLLPDDKVSQDLLNESYTLVKELKDPLTLAPNERTTLDFTIPKAAGDYVVIYDVRYAEGQAAPAERPLIAGGALPFWIPEPLAVITRNFLLLDKTIEVRADLRYVDGWDTKSTIAAKFTQAAAPDKALFERQWTGEQARTRLEFDLPIKDAAPGKYSLSLTANDASGKKLGERRTEITIPQTPEWYARPVGLAPVIPPPWKPIEVKDKKLSFLMGEYELNDSVLPAQIRVRSIFDDKREPILRAPVRLHGVVDGKPVEWKGRAKMDEKKPELVRASSSAVAGNIALNATGEFEFDGLQKITLNIAPAEGQPSITQLTLSIPLVKGFADLYRLNRAIVHPDKVTVISGTIPAQGIAHDWRPNVWLGNTRRGIEWFAENWRGWRVSGDFAKQAIEVGNGADGVTLHVHFIRVPDAKPLKLDKPRQIVFGLMFTPPRDINRAAVRHGLGYYFTEGGKGHAEKLPGEIANGMNCVEVWNHYDLQGWPDQTPERSAELKKMADNLHSKGIKVTPYSGWFISRKAEVYPTWGAEMLVEPPIDAGCGCDTACWNSPLTEAYLWQLRKASIESGYDGFRMDAGFSVSPCSSLKHRGYGSVCGWKDDFGNLQPSVGIFAAREASKRAYRMYHSKDITEDGLCLHHIHGGCRIAAIMSFWDAAVSAEGGERTAKTMKDFDLSYWRSAIMEDRSGLQLIYWPKTDTLGCDSRSGVAALHRLTIRGGSLVSLKEASYSRAARPIGPMWLAEDWVQWLDKGTEFYGYWENSKWLQTGRPELYGSFHVRRGDKVLLALFNRDLEPIEQTVRLDLKALGFKGDVHALDAVLNEPIAIKDGAITLEFTAESFRLIKIAAKPFDVVVPKKTGDNLLPELQPSAMLGKLNPPGWTMGDPAAFSLVNNEIVITGKADKAVTMSRSLALPAGNSYVLEADVRIDADEGTYLGPAAELHHFGIVFGGSYFPLRTLGSELLPGRYQTFKIYYTTPKDNPVATARMWLNGNGKVYIRRIGVYEVDARP